MYRIASRGYYLGLLLVLPFELGGWVVQNAEAQTGGQPFRSGMPARPNVARPQPQNARPPANTPNVANTPAMPNWSDSSAFQSNVSNNRNYGRNYGYSPWNSWGYNDWNPWNTGVWPYWNTVLSINTVNPAMNSFYTMPTTPYPTWFNGGVNPFWNYANFNPFWSNNFSMNPMWNNFYMNQFRIPFGAGNGVPVGNWNPLVPPNLNGAGINGDLPR